MATEIVFYLCQNSPATGIALRDLERRARAASGGVDAVLREVPCSGKIDVPYLLKAFEGGARGVAVITCPLGDCRLVEGNYRAQARAQHLGRLLDEIGLGAERFILLHSATEAQGADVPELVEQAATRLGALSPTPLDESGETERTVAT